MVSNMVGNEGVSSVSGLGNKYEDYSTDTSGFFFYLLREELQYSYLQTTVRSYKEVDSTEERHFDLSFCLLERFQEKFLGKANADR